MFKLIQCAENTYYLSCFANTGVYYLGNNEVMLIDSCDHKKSVTDLDKALTERGWRVKMIVNTHSHLDHIHGNDFFREKYGCKIYASQTEKTFVDVLDLERVAYFTAVPMRTKFEPVFVPQKPETELLTKDILPDGFDIISLPGHTINMVGIKTADDVWFTGDAVLAKETFEQYGIPFFLLTNESIKTAKMLATLEGKFFVPSHAQPCEDISELALYNAEALTKIKQFILSIADGRSLEEIMQEADRLMKLDFYIDKYSKVIITVKGMLQSLINDGKLTAVIENSKMVYKAL